MNRYFFKYFLSLPISTFPLNYTWIRVKGYFYHLFSFLKICVEFKHFTQIWGKGAYSGSGYTDRNSQILFKNNLQRDPNPTNKMSFNRDPTNIFSPTRNLKSRKTGWQLNSITKKMIYNHVPNTNFMYKNKHVNTDSYSYTNIFHLKQYSEFCFNLVTRPDTGL